MTAKRRPTAVTAIGRLILISGILGGIIAVTWVVGVRVSPDFRRIMLTYNSPLTLPWAMVGSVVFIASGAGMLRGRNWGRVVYLVYAPATIVAGVFLYGLTGRGVVAAMLYLLFLVLLTRPAAEEFLRGRG